MGCDQFCAICFAFIAPPLAVCCYKGCNGQAWLCLLLTLLLPYIGGLVYAIVVISQGKEPKVIGAPLVVVMNHHSAQRPQGDQHHHYYAPPLPPTPQPQHFVHQPPPTPEAFSPPPPYNIMEKY